MSLVTTPPDNASAKQQFNPFTVLRSRLRRNRIRRTKKRKEALKQTLTLLESLQRELPDPFLQSRRSKHPAAQILHQRSGRLRALTEALVQDAQCKDSAAGKLY